MSRNITSSEQDFSGWETDRLLKYYHDLGESQCGRDRKIRVRVVRILDKVLEGAVIYQILGSREYNIPRGFRVSSEEELKSFLKKEKTSNIGLPFQYIDSEGVKSYIRADAIKEESEEYMQEPSGELFKEVFGNKPSWEDISGGYTSFEDGLPIVGYNFEKISCNNPIKYRVLIVKE